VGDADRRGLADRRVTAEIVIVAGMITGCAGGAQRDILRNDVPLLRSESHASVSVVTGLFYATGFALMLNGEIWTALTFLLGLTFTLSDLPLRQRSALSSLAC
jgi:uncharacterized membrane protein YeiH